MALCGAMWRYPKKLENCIFPGFLVFGQNLEKRLWHYVALCGAMWRYPKKLENCMFPGFLVFGQNLEKRLWHYVALCGAIPKSLKIAFFPVFSFLYKTWKKGCGTMWRYVALARFCVKLGKKVVALCGAMCRYPKKLENRIFPGFLVFWQNLEKRLWHYVALCGAITKRLKIAVFPFFSFLGQTWKKGCGTMWRYVALSQKGVHQ